MILNDNKGRTFCKQPLGNVFGLLLRPQFTKHFFYNIPVM